MSDEKLPNEQKRLDVQKSFEEIKKIYRSNIEKRGFNALIYGDKGAGKTTLLRTARRPILVDSFDPGGGRVLIDEVEKGGIIVDSRWESDNPKEPTAWVLWLAEMDRREKQGMFDYLGTYCLDSITTLQMVSMNRILKDRNRADGIPETGKGKENDYVMSQAAIERIVERILGLHCDTIFTAHPDLREDEGSKRKFIGPMLTGAMAMRLPLLFDEMYYAKAEIVHEKEGDKKKYSLLTTNDGLYRASSRLGRMGLLAVWEDQNIKSILRKCKMNDKDKEI